MKMQEFNVKRMAIYMLYTLNWKNDVMWKL